MIKRSSILERCWQILESEPIKALGPNVEARIRALTAPNIIHLENNSKFGGELAIFRFEGLAKYRALYFECEDDRRFCWEILHELHAELKAKEVHLTSRAGDVYEIYRGVKLGYSWTPQDKAFHWVSNWEEFAIAEEEYNARRNRGLAA
jgi:hypothetical protein